MRDAKTQVLVVGHFLDPSNAPVSLVQVRLHTGRRHQIRAHLRYEGHPLVGDTTYGTGAEPWCGSLFLHSYHLGLSLGFPPFPACLLGAPEIWQRRRRQLCRPAGQRLPIPGRPGAHRYLVRAFWKLSMHDHRGLGREAVVRDGAGGKRCALPGMSQEKTPFISWISTRALRAGDQVAFGAAQTGALGPGVTAVDRAVVEIGGYICDASARQVENSDELVQSRTLNCALDLAGPSLATLQIRSLAVGYDDPRCAHYPCIDYSTSEGYGNAVFRTWQGTAQKASAFLQPNFQAYDLAIYPDILGIRPGRSGILNGAPVHIRGSTFDTDLTKNIVTVGEDPCEVKSANATNIICELEEVQSNVSCVEFEIFIGANPASGVKLVQHDGNSLEVAACHAEGTGRSFTVNLNASAKTGYYWVEDSCQAEGRQIKGHMAEESEDRLTFCCAMDGSSCEGPRYGQVTTTQPSYWTGWGPWVQLETTTPDPLFGTCLQPQSHKDAEMTCQLTGMRLCTRKELNSGLCCAADCIGEGSAEVGTWSSETGYLQELAILSDDGQPWTEELWIRCDENCQFPFNVTYPDSNGTTLTTTKYTPEQIALWEFAPWLRPADYEPPKEAEEILPLGPPVPEPLLPPSPPLKAPFPGGRGLVYQVFYNPYNLPLHRALGYENPGYPQSPMETGVLADMLRGALHHVKFESVPSTSLAAKRLYVTATPLSDDTGYDLYAEEITGYFIAPYTGVYTFYLAADDEADLSLSNSDMAAMKVIVRASSTDQAMPRFTPLAWFGKHCAQGQGLPEDANAPCSVSAPLQFKAGDRTLLRIRHREHLGADWLRVGLRIRSATTAEGLPPPPDLARSKSFVEVQRLTMTASVVRERHRIDLDRVLRGSFFVRVRRFENNFLREGTSGVVYYGDNPEKLATVLWETQDLYGRVLQCQPTVTQSEGFERFSYFVTFPCPKPADGNAHAAAMTIIPGLDVIGTSVVTWVMNSRLLQSSSPVVTGSFRLSFAGYWTQDIPYHGWDLIEPELLKLPISEVRLWPFQEVLQEGREGWSVGLLLGGGEDMPQIQVDIRQLEGPGVRLISETMANGSADLFMEELPADWFRTVHSQPQVVVESNGVVAMSLDASVRRSEDFTPRLMELQPLAVQVGTELQLRFDRVDGNHLRALLPHQRPFDVWVGPSPCNLTLLSCENGVERNCGAFPEVWNVRCTISDGRAGPQDLKVVIDGQGCPQFTNVTIAMPLPHIEFVPMIYSVQPSIGSWAGGTVVVLTGYGLQGDEACELVHFGERRLLEVPSDYYEENKGRATDPLHGTGSTHETEGLRNPPRNWELRPCGRFGCSSDSSRSCHRLPLQLQQLHDSCGHQHLTITFGSDQWHGAREGLRISKCVAIPCLCSMSNCETLGVAYR
ncbi:unnamed protein product [Durusdinium trenchii]|uniref:PA14 domain-containing protein n=1 Tax=Durusdinium trenchii TaxID=1381693 RepID=A0ABP0MG71_9DINO